MMPPKLVNSYRPTFGLTAFIKFWTLSVVMVIASIVLTPSNHAHAQEAASSVAATKAQDTFGRDTPRGSVQGFLQALAQDDLLLASRYLNLKNTKNPSGMVRELKAALDSGGRLASELQLSNEPTGKLDDKLAPNLEKVGEITNGSETIDILLEQVTQPNDSRVWLISQKTLQKLPDVSADAKPTLVEQYIPQRLIAKDFKGYSLGHMIAVMGLLLATFLSCVLISWLLYQFFKGAYRFFNKTPQHEQVPIDGRVVVPMAMVLTGVVIKELMLIVGINLVMRNLVERMADILSWVALAWLLMRIIDILFKRAERVSLIGNHPERLSVINLMRKVLKVILLAVATIVILGNLGFDLTTGIAALGIGGLALALGAQKTIENLVGSVSLVADQPVNVGDYCKFGAQEGTVEDIGIRSTRLRTTNRTVVTIPNGNFSAMSIENFSSRDMFHFSQLFYVSRDSDTQKLREFIETVQIYITNHPATNSTWNQARISGTQQDAYIIEVRCYMTAKSLMEFNERQTDMILKIADMMKDAGLKNALPTSHITMDAMRLDKDNRTESDSKH